MFERFTEPARGVVVLAHDEARELSHDCIGTGHLLLGLLREDRGLAARVLASLGVTAADVRSHVGAVGGGVARDMIPFMPPARNALERASSEADALGHEYVGTEHVLLGIVREREGAACEILRELGADPELVHAEVIRALSGPN